MRNVSRFLGAVILTAAAHAGTAAAQDAKPAKFPVLNTIWSFGHSGDGTVPQGTPAFDGTYLYGTTLFGGASGMGTIYQLGPTGGGGWTETVLYSFGAVPDGATPEAPVLLGSGGILYTTTRNGGASNLGAVVQLSPPATAGGAWTESVIYSFAGGSDGANPESGLLQSGSGALYGTTTLGGASGQGTVYQLTPPAVAGGAWTESVLDSFSGGTAGQSISPSNLVAGPQGVLYGATGSGGAENNGAVFELTPPAVAGGTWTQTTLHDFAGGARGKGPFSLALGDLGALFGVASGAKRNGIVFRLTPPATGGGAWVESVIHTFDKGKDGFGPRGLILTHDTIYGTTFRTVFSLHRPATKGGAWTERVLYRFPNARHGDGPASGVILGEGALFGTTVAGGLSNDGTVFELVP